MKNTIKKYSGFSLLGLTALTSLIGACAAPSPMMMPMRVPMQSMSRPMMAQTATRQQLQQDPTQLLAMLKELYGKELADSMQQGKPTPAIDQLLEQNGPAAYRLLSQDPGARQQMYPYSDQMVMREYNKPSPADNIAPISGPELQALLARLKPGDVILCGNDGSFVHGALYLGQGQIVHSLATQPDMHDRFRGVVQESLAVYTARSERDSFVVLRPKGLTAQGFAKAANWSRQQVGKGYDSLFLNASDDRFYCTELVWKAMMQLQRPPRVRAHRAKYGWEMVTVEDFMDSPDFETVYTRTRQRAPIGKIHQY